MPEIYLIIGLGNPGRQYSKTRHNLGFMVVDRIISTFDGSLEKINTSAEIAQLTIGNSQVIAVKPQTYMNNSGIAVQALVQHFNINLDHLLVVYDDINLDFGRLKLKGRGSSGGHNGMESILTLLQSDEFARLRIGIGSEKMPHDMIHFVLSGFTRSERQELDDILNKAEKAITGFITDGLDKTMNAYNIKLNK